MFAICSLFVLSDPVVLALLSVRDGSGLAQIVALVVRGCWYSGPALPLPIRSWVWLSGGLPLLLIMAFLAIYIAPSLGGLSSACPLAYLILPLVQFSFWFSRAPRSTAGQPSAAGTHFGRSSFSRSFRPLRRLPPLFGSSVNWPHLSVSTSAVLVSPHEPGASSIVVISVGVEGRTAKLTPVWSGINKQFSNLITRSSNLLLVQSKT